MFARNKLKDYAKKAVVVASIIAALSSGAFSKTKKVESPFISQKIIMEVEKNPKLQQQLNLLKDAFSLLESAIKKGIYTKEGDKILRESQKLLTYGTNVLLGIDKPTSKNILLEYYTILHDAQIEESRNYLIQIEKEIKTVNPGSQEQAKIHYYAWLHQKDLAELFESPLSNSKQKKAAQRLIKAFKTYTAYTSKQEGLKSK